MSLLCTYFNLDFSTAIYHTLGNNYSINTRYKANLHPPLLRLSKYQKGVYYTGIKTYNCLPSKLRGFINNKIQFKKELKKFLLRGSFYTVEEYLDWTSMHDLHALYL